VLLVAACAHAPRQAAEPEPASATRLHTGDFLDRAVFVEVMLGEQALSRGHGFVVGPGLVASAAHVVDEVPNGGHIRVSGLNWSRNATPWVGGSPEDIDGVLLYVHGEALPIGPERIPLCRDPVRPAQPLQVYLRGGAFETHGSPDQVMRASAADGVFTDHITHSLADGASGAGVVDVANNCLAGVVSTRRSVWVGSAEQRAQLHTSELTPAAELKVLFDRLPRTQR